MRAEDAKIFKWEGTFRTSSLASFYRPKSAGRKALILNLLSPHPLTLAPTRQRKEQRRVGVEGRIRASEVRGSRAGRDGLASNRAGTDEGVESGDLISCFGRGSVRRW